MIKPLRRAGLALAILLGPTPLLAAPPELAFPLDCVLGKTCFIQQYVDTDPGPAALDYTCGPLVYDGHRGTDIRVAHRDQIAGAGVRVLAAAAGKVLAVRNDITDIAQDDPNAPDVHRQECGNGVLLAHPDGWRTLYCHMRQGSVSVRKGQKIATGQPLGLIGLSGKTEFPHLHIRVEHRGKLVDPFQPKGGNQCSTGQQTQLWRPALPYSPGGLLSTGIATDNLSLADIHTRRHHSQITARTAPALAAWGYFYGLMAGDVVDITLRFPDGRVLAAKSYDITKHQAESYRLTGKRRKGDTWPVGVYTGQIRLLRDGREIVIRRIETRIE